MLEQLLIKNFAIIEDLDITFNSGFISLCGETGAGKSIIIDALSLLLGERSNFDKIRLNKQKAFIEGVFSVSNKKIIHEIENILDDSIEDNMIYLTRVLDINGKSYAKINSHNVPLSTLKKVTQLLLDIHSQQNDNGYLNKNNQFNLLDIFLFNLLSKEEREVFDQYDFSYEKYLNIKKKIDDLKEKKSLLEQEDYLIYQKDELEKANVQVNEMENLEEEKNSLMSFSRQSEKIISFIKEYENASSYLYNAKKQLSYLDSDEFSSLVEKFNDLYFQIEDIYQEINNKFEESKDSLNRLEMINDRLFFLHSLRKKYGYSTEDILNKYQQILSNIDDIKNYETKLHQYENELDVEKKKTISLANNLTDIRKKYSVILTNEINNQLKDLYLENAEFKVEFSSFDELSKIGLDNIQFLLKANAGLGFLPLEKSASLGETSRLNLALKTVFNKLNTKETIIFDEIDIGISGRVAIAISKKMKEISKYCQVISISHLAQVCASADYQYLVKKDVIDNVTYSSIKLLDDSERIIEIAKMITGEVNDVSLSASKELIDNLK